MSNSWSKTVRQFERVGGVLRMTMLTEVELSEVWQRSCCVY